MNKLKYLIEDFWKWTGLFEHKYGKIDIRDLSTSPVEFPRIGEICDVCFEMINMPLNIFETDLFLMGMAIDSEDEDILNSCKEKANESFLITIISAGILYPQSEARWQIAELLRRYIPHRDIYLNTLLHDPDEYVRRRAQNVFEDLRNKTRDE